MRTIEFKPSGICAGHITIVLDDEERVQDLSFIGGCDGNHKGLTALIKGMTADEAIARLSGEIDHHNARELRSELDRFIASAQPRELAIDFGGITFMDSSGIGLIMGRSKLMKECGVHLEVLNPQPDIRRVLKL